MATRYVVLREERGTLADDDSGAEVSYTEVGVSLAANAIAACRDAAGDLDEPDLEQGVTLIAVPLRNWTSGRKTLKAETTRRIRSA